MAGLALLSWPIISLAIFARLGRERGLIWSVLIGYLFLPEAFGYDLSGLPTYNKPAAIAVGLLLGGLIGKPEDGPPVTTRSPALGWAVLAVLAVLLVISPTMTVLTNGEWLYFGPKVIEGLAPYDIISMSVGTLIWIVPFICAWLWLRDPKWRIEIFRALIAVGLVYSLLMLIEIRLSPQLHKWIYGYFQHSFYQHVRNGFRPIVFLGHGLLVGILLFQLCIASFALSRVPGQPRGPYMLAGLWFFLILLISRNLGALMIAMIFVPAVLFLSTRAQVRLAAIIAIVLLLYPLLYQYDLVPIDGILGWAEAISPARAASLRVRLENEHLMAARAMEKPLFGWGLWGRSFIFDSAGRGLNIVDGAWIITWGTVGWLGYLAYFGLISIGILWLWRRMDAAGPDPVVAGMAVLLAGSLIYLVPNSGFSPIGWMIAALVTLAAQVAAAPEVQAEEEETRKKPGYSRFGDGAAQSPKRPRPAASTTARRAFDSRYSRSPVTPRE